jgi:hypothetical protein
METSGTWVEAEPAEPQQCRAQCHEGHVMRLLVVVFLILWDLSAACQTGIFQMWISRFLKDSMIYIDVY